MTDNLPAVRSETAPVVVVRDTDSWAEQLPKVVDLARAIASTDFVPEAMRDNIAATAAAILYGREVGLPPMTALNNVNVIKGRPGLSAAIMRAQVLAAGHEIRQDESNAGRCVLSGRRRGTDYWQTVEYTIDDAKQAGLTKPSRNGEPSMYVKHPRRMLRARATTELCELMFADVIRGMPSLEELRELDDDNAAEPAAPTRAKVQRKQQRTTPQTDGGAAPLSGTDSSPAAPSSPPLPPLPGEPGYDSVGGIAEQGSSSARGTASTAGPDSDGILPLPEAEDRDSAAPEGGDEATDSTVSSSPEDVKMNTRAQQRGLFALFKGLGIVDDAERMQVTADLVGRMPMHDGKPSWNGMTWDEANQLTTMMSTVKTRDQVEALIELAEQQRAGGDQA